MSDLISYARFEVMKIYTKKGDQGETSFANGQRVSKSHQRIAAYGEVDELNAVVGMCLEVISKPVSVVTTLREVQSQLFQLGSELALAGTHAKDLFITAEDVKLLENGIDEMDTVLPPLKNFILPGGSEAASRLHLARTVCRRAERALVTLHEKEPVRDEAIHYLNRLSDYLFTCARMVLKVDGKKEILWKS